MRSGKISSSLLDFHKKLREHVEACLVRSTPETPITSVTGGTLNWLLDLRPLFLNADRLAVLAEEFWKRFPDRSPIQVGAIESAGIPLLTAILMVGNVRRRQVTGFIVRKERKRTGLGKRIEGSLSDAPIVMIDDTINSGDSLDIARVALSEFGRAFSSVFVVVDFHSVAGEEWRLRNEVNVSSIFALADLGMRPDNENSQPDLGYLARWHYPAQGANPFYLNPKALPLLVRDQLFVASDKGTMSAVNCETGQVNWQFKAPGTFKGKGIWSSPAESNGQIYFGAYNGNFYRLDAITGAAFWAMPLCDWIGSSPVILSGHGLVVVGLEYERPRAKGSMVALSLETGGKIWETWLQEYQHGSAAYSIETDFLICGTNDHNVLSLAPKSGEILWRFPTRRSVKYAPTIDAARDIVAFASMDKSIYVLRASTGEKLLEFETNDGCYTTPLIAGKYMFCGSGDRHLYIFDLDKMDAIKRIDMKSRVYATPVLRDDTVIVGTTGGIVCEIDLLSLKVKGTFRVADAITNAVAVSPDGRTIYVPTYMNEIFAFTRA